MRVWKDPLVIIAVVVLAAAAGYVAWLYYFDPTAYELAKISQVPVLGWPGQEFVETVTWNALQLFFFWIIGEFMAAAADSVTRGGLSRQGYRPVLSAIWKALDKALFRLILITLAIALLDFDWFVNWHFYRTLYLSEFIARLPHYCLLLFCVHLAFRRTFIQPWLSFLTAFAALNLHAWHSQYIYSYWAKSADYRLLPSWLWALVIALEGLVLLWMLQYVLIRGQSGRRWPWLAAGGLGLVVLPVVGSVVVVLGEKYQQLVFLPFPLKAVLNATYAQAFPMVTEAASYHANYGSLLDTQLPFFGWMLPALAALGAYLAVYALSCTMWLFTARTLATAPVPSDLAAAPRFNSSHATLWTMRALALITIVYIGGLWPWLMPTRADWGRQSPAGTVFSEAGWGDSYVMPPIDKWQATS